MKEDIFTDNVTLTV